MEKNHQTPPEAPRDIEGLKKAIRAIGRFVDSDDARANLIREATKLGHADLVPDAWRKDGSVKGTAWSREQRETYQDTFTALNGAVSDAMDDDYCYCWVQDFTDSEVIFYAGGDMWSVGYTLEPGGAVTLAGEAVKVRPVTSYVARVANEGLEFRKQRAADLDGAREVRRFHADGCELREVSDGTLRFTGYASITERAYEVGDFEETIARGAFKRTLSESPDVMLLLNHEGLPLARTKSGTLTLAEDARGLRVDADLNPADPDVQRLRPKLERGDVDEMSFAFRPTGQEWNDEYTQRRITGASIHKGDVSIVTYGANDASTGGLVGALRSLESEAMELRAGKTLSAKTRGEVQEAYDKLGALLSESDPPETEPTVTEVAQEAVAALEVAREAEEPESKVIPLPDLTTRRRERLAVLRGGRR